MNKSLPPLLGALALFVVASALAGPIDYLFSDDRICDAEKSFCMRGTLTYRSNPRLLSLNARIQTAPGPGMLRITISGKNQQGDTHYAPVEVHVRGNYSEIINQQMIPDHPDVSAWVVDRIEFIPDAS